MRLHAAAVRELAAWQPDLEDQRRRRQEFLGFLDANPDGVWRHCTPAHLTASAVVLDPTLSAVLLVLHRKVQRWLQPGGHCEPGDDSLALAALREAAEESGIGGLRLLGGPCHLDRHAAPCRQGVVEEHLDVRFAMTAPPGATPAVSAESIDVRWFPWDQLPQDADAGTVALVAAGRAQLTGLPPGRPHHSPSALSGAPPALSPSRDLSGPEPSSAARWR